MKHLGNGWLLLLVCCPIFTTAQITNTDSLLRIVQENRQDLAELKAVNALAEYYSHSDPAKAKGYMRWEIAMAGELKDAKRLAAGYGHMLIAQLNEGRPDSGRYYLDLLKELAASDGTDQVKSVYNAQAGLFYKIQGNNRAALPFMMESLREASALMEADPTVAHRTAVAGQNLNIGNVYLVMQDYRKALEFHLKALQLFEEVGNKRGISYCYQGISAEFLNLHRLKDATAYCSKAIALKSEINDQRGIGTSLKQMGSICLVQEQYDSALSYYLKAQKVFRDMKLVAEEADINTDIGLVYTKKNDLPSANIYYRNSKELARQIGDSSRAASADAAIFSLQTTINRQQQAEKKLISHLQTSIEAGDRQSEILNYQYLADHYSSLGAYDKALDYTQKMHRVEDSLQDEAVQVQLKKMESQYNFDKKEKEIALLKKDKELTFANLQKEKAIKYGAFLLAGLLLLIGFLVINRYRIVQKTRRMLELEKMRNHIARDLHDDIGSTLTSINILSKMALHDGEEGAPPVLANLRKIKDRSSAIMEKMDDIVWAINPQHDTMEQLLFRMKEFAAETLEPLNIQYAFEETGDFSAIKLDIKKRKDLYLLFKEGINNAAKYSQCAHLNIRLQQQGDFLHMEINDDGKGFVEDQVRGGNGLSNMRERATAMAAKILIDSSLGKGTRIVLDTHIT
jgi:signal transduction histidine kinase